MLDPSDRIRKEGVLLESSWTTRHLILEAQPLIGLPTSCDFTVNVERMEKLQPVEVCKWLHQRLEPAEIQCEWLHQVQSNLGLHCE